MLIPFIGRMRRRRLLMLIGFIIFSVWYLTSSQDQPGQQQTSQFVPASSPEDDMETLQKTPAKAPRPPATGDGLSSGDAASADLPLYKQPVSSGTTAGDKLDVEGGKSASEKSGDTKTARPANKPTISKVEMQWQAPNGFEQQQITSDPPGTVRMPKTLKIGGRTFIDPATQPMVPMEYGTTARPPVKGLAKVIEELPVELTVDDVDERAPVESLVSRPKNLLRRRRFVFIGDVHGQRKPLEELLEKIEFDLVEDHLVLVGDLINKGPDSAGVVQLAMDLGASAVRGNHEDRVLAAYDSMHATKPHFSKARQATVPDAIDEVQPTNHATLIDIEMEGKRERASAMLQREEDLRMEDAAKKKGILTLLGLRKEEKSEEDTINHEKMVAELDIDPLEQNPFPHGDTPERDTAASLSPEQAAWLSELPVILRLGKLAPSPAAVSASAKEANDNSPFNNVVVVHAGLVPDLPLERQDPYAAMVMRSLVHPADEVRHERAHAIAEIKLRAESRGRIQPNDHVNVPNGRVDAEFNRMQKMVYGPDSHHPHRPSAPGAPKNPAVGNPEKADLVMLPIEGHFREGQDRVHWAAAWNQAQHAISEPTNRTTVIYGHDAITGLLVPEPPLTGFLSMFGGGGNGAKSGSVVTEADTGYTFGLDSGAVYGGKLSALIVEAGKNGRVEYSIEQVECPAIAKKKYAD